MNSAVMFSRASDEWSTPQDFFDALDAEFTFDVDVAATGENAKCGFYFSTDAISDSWVEWAERVGLAFPPTCWMNPPYSQCRAFMGKAAQEAAKGCTVVCLVPSRTDTRWFHQHVYDATTHQYRPGVEVRFIPGRLKFGDGKNSAPFPSMLVIFRPVVSTRIRKADIVPVDQRTLMQLIDPKDAA